MGLDMYLYKDYYIGGNYEHRNVTGTVLLDLDGKRLPISVKKISSIRTLACYWRKANAIHKFFVDNVMEGNDECFPHYVSVEKLEELFDLCKQVSKKHKLAPDLLPSQNGIFFGSTDYDKWYFEDIKYTYITLREILAIGKIEQEKGIPIDYYYYPSW